MHLSTTTNIMGYGLTSGKKRMLGKTSPPDFPLADPAAPRTVSARADPAEAVTEVKEASAPVNSTRRNN
jgi:hypothetical protein